MNSALHLLSNHETEKEREGDREGEGREKGRKRLSEKKRKPSETSRVTFETVSYGINHNTLAD